MPIVFGCASSHAPSLFVRTYDGWNRVWNRLSSRVPQPPEASTEGPEVVSGLVARTERAFERLRAELTAAQPDVVIVLAGDQTEWFSDALTPNLMIFAGKEVVGFHNYGAEDHDPPLQFWTDPERFGARLQVDQDLANVLLDGLVAQGFDVAISRRAPAVTEPRRAAPHALVRPLPVVLPSLEMPIVPLMMKTVERSPAILSGDRCLALGRAIERVCRNLPQRIALYASGGMSHDPMGPRSGWVDEPLDRWFLNHLAHGTPDALGALFSFRSATLDNGTGELRTWLPVASAMDACVSGIRADVIEYFPASKATTGNGWVSWPTVSIA